MTFDYRCISRILFSTSTIERCDTTVNHVGLMEEILNEMSDENYSKNSSNNNNKSKNVNKNKNKNNNQKEEEVIKKDDR